MQDRYVGDVGDFGKFGLLRCLSGMEPRAEPRLRLGIDWYLVPNESHNEDGRHTAYLGKKDASISRYECCDPYLYRQLGSLIFRGDRRVGAIHDLGIFPNSTRYFELPLSFSGTVRSLRPAMRSTWLQGALEATDGCDLVFADPDNGLEVPSTGKFRSRGPKYAFYDDLSPFLQRGQSVVIYQHVDRRGSVGRQAERRAAEICEQLGVSRVLVVQFVRGSRRLFFIVPSPAHDEILRERTTQLLVSSWGQQGHFQPVLELADGRIGVGRQVTTLDTFDLLSESSQRPRYRHAAKGTRRETRIEEGPRCLRACFEQ